MDDLVQALGTNVALIHHTAEYTHNSHQEYSDGEDDDQTEWVKKDTSKTSLSIQDSTGRPKFVSWASEMSMYERRPSLLKNMNSSNRYMSALESLSGKKLEKLSEENTPPKMDFCQDTKGIESNYKKLNSLPLPHESRLQQVRSESQSEHADHRMDQFVTVSNPRQNEKPSLGNFTSTEKSTSASSSRIETLPEGHQLEQSPKLLSQSEILQLQAECPDKHDRVESEEDVNFLECKQQIQALKGENQMLKEDIVRVRERNQNVEKSLREENVRLLMELMNLKRSLKIKQKENALFKNVATQVCQHTPDSSKVHNTFLNQPLRSPSEMASPAASKLDSRDSDSTVSDAQFTEESTDELSMMRGDDRFDQTPDQSKADTLSVQPHEEKGVEVESSQTSTNKKNRVPQNDVVKSGESKCNVPKSGTRRKSGKNNKGKKELKAPVFDFTNLIVNYLPPEMDCGMLQKVFSPYGDIISCKVVMDHKTRLSKGYGFVKFRTKEQANVAVKELDQRQVGGKVLKVACARKPERGKSYNKQTNLYIANLDKSVVTGDIERVFGTCGYVVQCRVLKDVRGVTRRIGFVRYDTHENALRAIRSFDGKTMEGTKSVIQVRFANTPKPPPSVSRITPLQVSLSPRQPAGQLSPLLSPGDSGDSSQGIPYLPNSLAASVDSYGDLVPPASHQHTHFTHISPHPEHGAHMNTCFTTDGYLPESQTPKSAACYVSGINATTEEAEIKRLFDPEGINIIKSVRVIRRRAGPYAFVNFFKIEDALRAVKTLNETQMGNRTLTVRLR